MTRRGLRPVIWQTLDTTFVAARGNGCPLIIERRSAIVFIASIAALAAGRRGLRVHDLQARDDRAHALAGARLRAGRRPRERGVPGLGPGLRWRMRK